jgi:ribosomal protein S18 acetylase RimI-like enzyme
MMFATMTRKAPMEFTRQAFIRAIEENGAEFLLAMGRAAGAEEHQSPEIHWIIGGSPIDYHNGVVRANLPPDIIDGVIQASIRRFESRGVPGTWHVGPSMRPDELGVQLVSHGFVFDGEEIGMAVALNDLPAELPAPAALTVERVVDEPGLEAWTSVLARSFGEGEREAFWVRDVYRRIGLTDDVPWRHYLGRLGGEPVGTASLFMGAGAAGVYFVSTRPDARRQGLGTALTLAALRDGRALGERVGVLGASMMGNSVYRRLGMEEYCRIAIYAWRPAVDAAQE